MQMPPRVTCANANGNKPKTYPLGAKDKTPKAKGVCARHEKVGNKRVGADGTVYIVVARSNGVHYWRRLSTARVTQGTTAKKAPLVTKKAPLVTKKAPLVTPFVKKNVIRTVADLKLYRAECVKKALVVDCNKLNKVDLLRTVNNFSTKKALSSRSSQRTITDNEMSRLPRPLAKKNVIRTLV